MLHDDLVERQAVIDLINQYFDDCYYGAKGEDIRNDLCNKVKNMSSILEYEMPGKCEICINRKYAKKPYHCGSCEGFTYEDH